MLAGRSLLCLYRVRPGSLDERDVVNVVRSEAFEAFFGQKADPDLRAPSTDTVTRLPDYFTGAVPPQPGSNGDGFLHTTLARIGGSAQPADLQVVHELCAELNKEGARGNGAGTGGGAAQGGSWSMEVGSMSFIEYSSGTMGINDPLGDVIFEEVLPLLAGRG